ncbi:MAG: response regulator, partial [Pirellula staleyi]
MSNSPDQDFRSILLVDDSFILRDRLAEAFLERGFRVVVAGTCDEAVALYRLDPTDLAVVDLRMPGRTGLTVIADLKAIRPDVQVLILSGFGSIATAIDAIRVGAVNFLPKPADADDILNA